MKMLQKTNKKKFFDKTTQTNVPYIIGCGALKPDKRRGTLIWFIFWYCGL